MIDVRGVGGVQALALEKDNNKLSRSDKPSEYLSSDLGLATSISLSEQ